MNSNTLWFYWGQPHMRFLRYLTLVSAVKVHPNITLVVRRNSVRPLDDCCKWAENQDFQFPYTLTPNYMAEARELPINIVELEDLAPGIAAIEAPDVQTADILAWWLLATYGGTVADMDIVFLRPLPEIERDVAVVQFWGPPKFGYIPVSFMQGQPCDGWGRSYDDALARYRPEKYESCGSKCFSAGEAGQLPERIVFPWAGMPWSKYRHWLFEAESWPAIPEECIGIHWYAGHNQDFNQKINGPKDLKAGAIAWAAKEVLK